MTEPDDSTLERLRADHARLPRQAPDTAVDAAIRAAAERVLPRRRLRVWSGALAAASVVGFAVMLVPALLTETHAPVNAYPATTELQVRVRRPAEFSPPAKPEPDSAGGAMAFAPAPAAPLVAAESEAMQRVLPADTVRREVAREAAKNLTLEGEHLAAPEVPPSSEAVAAADTAAMKKGAELERLTVTGSRVTADAAATGITARVVAESAGLADADEAAWRERLLTLRADGMEDIAQALLPEFRARFDQPETLTLDDLAREAEAAPRR